PRPSAAGAAREDVLQCVLAVDDSGRIDCSVGVLLPDDRYAIARLQIRELHVGFARLDHACRRSNQNDARSLRRRVLRVELHRDRAVADREDLTVQSTRGTARGRALSELSLTLSA